MFFHVALLCSVCPISNVNIFQEPRKSDAPQLRDEYRTYKILVGCREFPLLSPFTNI